jgi:hypothetical protein
VVWLTQLSAVWAWHLLLARFLRQVPVLNDCQMLILIYVTNKVKRKLMKLNFWSEKELNNLVSHKQHICWRCLWDLLLSIRAESTIFHSQNCYGVKAKLVQFSYEMVKKWSIVIVRWCFGMMVRPWYVGSTGNDDDVQQVQLSEAWPVTDILVDGWRLMVLK